MTRLVVVDCDEEYTNQRGLALEIATLQIDINNYYESIKLLESKRVILLQMIIMLNNSSLDDLKKASHNKTISFLPSLGSSRTIVSEVLLVISG